MVDERLEKIFDDLKGAYDDLYDYICEKQGKDHDNSAKVLFNWHEQAVKDYAVVAIKAFSHIQFERDLEQVLFELSGILDSASEHEDKAERDYINNVESKLHNMLKQEGLI